MKKLKLYGVKKSAKHSVFEIAKCRDAIMDLKKFLINIGFDRFGVNDIFSPLGNSDDNYSLRKYSNKLYDDKFFYFENEKNFLKSATQSQ